MWVRNLKDCEPFLAGDKTQLRELIHPDKHPLALRYSLAEAVLPAGQTSTPHALTTAEVYYILTGTGEMHIDDEVQVVTAGDAIYIPPQGRQYIHNISDTDLVFICIVDPAWRQEDEVIFS